MKAVTTARFEMLTPKPGLCPGGLFAWSPDCLSSVKSQLLSVSLRGEKMFLLTDEDIRKDIRGFEKRIQEAKAKLAKLPETVRPWQARKKLKEKRRILTSEIEHVKRLITIAKEATTDL